jgi:glycosyltransferase involved in cell wall biosynthesis
MKKKGKERRIVVVYVIDNMRLGGTELNAVRTAERLDRERFELRVVCLSEDGPLTERYRAIGVPVVNLGLRSFYGPSMLRSGWRFIQLLRRARADVVHAHDVYSNIFTTVWTRLAGVSALIASRRWWHSLPSRKLQLGNRLAFARADAVLANSLSVADSVRDEAKVRPDRIRVITNFVEEDAFQPITAEERASRRREWGVHQDTLVIGCVARLVPVKNHAMLIRAVARLHAAGQRACLVLIGDGESRSSLERLAADLGIQDSVRFVGELRDGGNHHRVFDISALASHSEGFPNTLVEAMAAARPVVATRVGGTADAVVDGETGFLVPSDDDAAFAAALDALVKDASRREVFGANGQARARALFHESHVLSSLERLYSQLVGLER